MLDDLVDDRLGHALMCHHRRGIGDARNVVVNATIGSGGNGHQTGRRADHLQFLDRAGRNREQMDLAARRDVNHCRHRQCGSRGKSVEIAVPKVVRTFREAEILDLEFVGEPHHLEQGHRRIGTATPGSTDRHLLALEVGERLDSAVGEHHPVRRRGIDQRNSAQFSGSPTLLEGSLTVTILLDDHGVDEGGLHHCPVQKTGIFDRTARGSGGGVYRLRFLGQICGNASGVEVIAATGPARSDHDVGCGQGHGPGKNEDRGSRRTANPFHVVPPGSAGRFS